MTRFCLKYEELKGAAEGMERSPDEEGKASLLEIVQHYYESLMKVVKEADSNVIVPMSPEEDNGSVAKVLQDKYGSFLYAKYAVACTGNARVSTETRANLYGQKPGRTPKYIPNVPTVKVINGHSYTLTSLSEEYPRPPSVYPQPASVYSPPRGSVYPYSASVSTPMTSTNPLPATGNAFPPRAPSLPATKNAYPAAANKLPIGVNDVNELLADANAPTAAVKASMATAKTSRKKRNEVVTTAETQPKKKSKVAETQPKVRGAETNVKQKSTAEKGKKQKKKKKSKKRDAAKRPTPVTVGENSGAGNGKGPAGNAKASGEKTGMQEVVDSNAANTGDASIKAGKKGQIKRLFYRSLQTH